MTDANYTGPNSKKTAFTSKETHPLLLGLILIKEFGPDYLLWEPETIWKEIELTFDTTVSEVNKNKIQAVKSCQVSDIPYEQWEVFEKVAISFDGGIPRFDIMQKPTPHSCAVALETMVHVRDEKISDEVYRYVAAVLADDGYAYGPGPLEPCNKFLLKLGASPDMQKHIAAQLKAARRPKFDGSVEDEIQVAKAFTIEDFTKFDSTKLMQQIETVLRGTN